MEVYSAYYFIHITGDSNLSMFFYIFKNKIEIDIYNNKNFELIKNLKFNVNHKKYRNDINYVVAIIKDLILEFILHDDENDDYIYYLKIITNYKYEKTVEKITIKKEKQIYNFIKKIENIVKIYIKRLIKIKKYDYIIINETSKYKNIKNN